MARFAMICAVLVLMCPGRFASADPEDLLGQAIEENSGTSAASAAEVKKLVGQADRLAEQRKFDEAIGLYERAYRLSPQNQSTYFRLLVAKQAAGRLTAEEQRALKLIREQESAAIDQAFRTVRIDILQIRGALRTGDLDLAKLKLKHAEATLDGLPRHMDSAIYRRELGNLREATVRRSKQADGQAESAHVAPGGRGGMILSEGLDDAETPSTQQGQAEPPRGEIIDVDAVLAETGEAHAYDRAMEQARRRNRSDWLMSNNEAAMAPWADMTLPADWRERTAKRAKYRDGVIYESEPFTGSDGQMYTTVIYDLGDLVHPVPNFYASDPGSALRQMLDRECLRERSQIFNGYAEDLAAGLPLLHFFGGVDNDAVRGRTDLRETDRIIQMIEQFVNGTP